MTKSEEINQILHQHIRLVFRDAINYKELIKAFIERDEKQLRLHNVVKSLPTQDLPNCTRVEVIDQKGRSYVNCKLTNKVRLSMQDDGRTAKIFID